MKRGNHSKQPSPNPGGLTRRLTAEQAEHYRPGFDNYRQLRQLVSQLEALSLQAADQAEGWGRNSAREVRKTGRKYLDFRVS